MEKIGDYLHLNDKYLKEAEALMEKGDYVQASEKFWGAAAEIVKAVAAQRGIEIRSHGELYRFITTLREEMDDPELTKLLTAAGTLHQNFYENWLPPRMVKDCGDAVKELVVRLRRLVE